ncbi:hypothetical protein PDJAM_G00095930 [Pangasius djambal]|uniref:Uncharacterized protein n=1 Tax=Pangasius djambal TaxID=1691987 RepID=A0ACC5Z8H3_9TELE|nr:hypothetical protein [Pangasius djambal]
MSSSPVPTHVLSYPHFVQCRGKVLSPFSLVVLELVLKLSCAGWGGCYAGHVPGCVFHSAALWKPAETQLLLSPAWSGQRRVEDPGPEDQRVAQFAAGTLLSSSLGSGTTGTATGTTESEVKEQRASM